MKVQTDNWSLLKLSIQAKNRVCPSVNQNAQMVKEKDFESLADTETQIVNVDKSHYPHECFLFYTKFPHIIMQDKYCRNT